MPDATIGWLRPMVETRNATGAAWRGSCAGAVRVALVGWFLLAGSSTSEAHSDGRLLLHDRATGATAVARIEADATLALTTAAPLRAGARLGTPRHRVVAMPGGLFLNRLDHHGRAEGRLIRIWPDGTLDPGEAGAGCGLPAARLAASGPFLVCYGTDGSIAVGRPVAGGLIEEFRAPAGTLPRYTDLIRTANHLVFWNRRSGALAVGQISYDAASAQHYLEVTDTGAAARRFQRIVAAADDLLLYDPASGRYQSVRIEVSVVGRPGTPDRRFEARLRRGAVGRMAAGLSHAAAVGSAVVLYAGDGSYTAGRFDHRGRFDVRDTGTTLAGFDHLVAAGERLFFLDGGGTGRAMVGAVTQAGRYRALRVLKLGRYDRVLSSDW
mgnify:CR=1 FL=1